MNNQSVGRKKKRRRDPLGDNYKDDKMKRITKVTYCRLEGEYGLKTPSQEEKKDMSFTMSELRKHDKRGRSNDDPTVSSVVLLGHQENLKKVPNILDARRQAIFYLFKLYGSPPQQDWQECNIVMRITKKLEIPLFSWI